MPTRMKRAPFSLVLTLLFTAFAAVAAPPEASRKIDALLAESWAKENVAPLPVADDATFLRRVYLDVAGRIPTAPEAEAFLHDADRDKRAKLIDALLGSEGYVSHFYNWWADMLRVNTETGPNRLSQMAYAEWVRESLRTNKPYDVMVRELVAAEGKVWENGATGYYLRDPGMPLDNLSNTVQVFLGTRIVCAQCHDHPFDKWKQMDYYKMAAFTYGVDTGGQPEFYQKGREWIREQAKAKAKEEFEAAWAAEQQKTIVAEVPPPADGGAKPAPPSPADEKARRQREQQQKLEKQRLEKRRRDLQAQIQRKHDEEARRLERLFGQAFQPVQNMVRATHLRTNDRLPKLPADYQYRDGKPGQAIEPVVMFGRTPELKAGEPRTRAFADWLTAPDNQRFTTVVANRLWKKVMGRGLIEPVDEFTDDTQASHPQVMAFLEQTMKDVRYDVRAYLRILLNTQLYQRESWTKELDAADRYAFPGPVLRRMTAEQVWDSFLTLTIPDVDRADPRRVSRYESELNKARTLSESLGAQQPEKLVELARELAELQKKNGNRNESLRKELAAARTAQNKPEIERLQKEQNQVRRSMEARAMEVITERTGARFDGGGEAMMMMMSDKGDGKKDARDGGKDDAKPDPATSTPEERKQWQQEREKRRQLADWRKTTGDLHRAVWMPSPAPRGHFLREFGQSDRETIDNASDEATVPQALNLLNGRMFDLVTAKYSVLSQNVMDRTSPDDRIATVYLSLLGQRPTETELGTLRSVLAERGEAPGLKDIVHAVINTRQFLFIK